MEWNNVIFWIIYVFLGARYFSHMIVTNDAKFNSKFQIEFNIKILFNLDSTYIYNLNSISMGFEFNIHIIFKLNAMSFNIFI